MLHINGFEYLIYLGHNRVIRFHEADWHENYDEIVQQIYMDWQGHGINTKERK